MGSALPSGAAGTAAGVMIYSIASLICSGLLIWLTWTHQERSSYIACISYLAVVSTLASIIQQIHFIAFWEDVVITQFKHKKTHPNSPENAIAGGSVGMDLVLFYIQYYCYSVQAMLVMFWCCALAQSVYGLTELSTLKRRLRTVNNVGKAVAVLFPLITILLLRAPAIQAHFVLFILLADLPLMVSLAIGSGLLLAILGRYIHTKRKLLKWSQTYGQSFSSGTGRPKGMYDRWLLLRFTIAFVMLAAFEVTNSLFQATAASNNRKDAASPAPNLSLGRTRNTLLLFLPGVTPGLFMFLIFGMTAAFRRHMREKLLPEGWRRRRHSDAAGYPGRRRSGARGQVEVLGEGGPRGSSRDTTESGIGSESVDVEIQLGHMGMKSDEWPILPGGRAGGGVREVL
ncbi:Glycoside hydrolase [Pleurostoma richardsiae]|uniref:Glycoside hydrolase n=1 Tax=Pleurostoma richardsiae TaxID=41990 RepID=A0AA38R4G4_9PEZI|nr:Glycoside hydrolase [Pleurostoma richardsiae]